MRIRTRVGIVVVAFPFWTGCVSVEPYPSTWAPPATASDVVCPAISGTFMNQGERGSTSYKPRLSDHFFLDDVAAGRADEVDLRLVNPNVLEVGLRANGSVLRNRTIHDFFCDRGFVVLRNRQFINRDGVLAAEKAVTSLGLSVDGALIVKAEISGVGTMFLVPAVSSSTSWSRHKPSASASNKALQTDAPQAPRR